MSETRLKACPFCGGRAITHRHSVGCWAVSCTQCDCKPTTTICRTEAEAITAWNTRIEATRGRDSGLVERVARAIHDARFGPDYPASLARDTLETTDHSGREYCYRLARAAIEALTPCISQDAEDGALALTWRPIETIPPSAYVDYESPLFVDLWGPIIGRFPNAYWSTKDKCWVSVSADGSECVSANHRITHWMELPGRPAALTPLTATGERS